MSRAAPPAYGSAGRIACGPAAAPAAAALVEPAAAKINLTLRVLGRRADGFHELDSLVMFARDAADVLTLTPGAPTELSVEGPFAAAIVGRNIVAEAMAALAERGVGLGRVVLDKRLPVASGIGGGSADAAALLRLAQRLAPDAIDASTTAAIAARLGSDVTACLASSALRMTGTGTAVALLPALSGLDAVLANPLAPVAADKTARVYRALALAPGSGTGIGAGDEIARVGDSFPLTTPRALIAALAASTNDLADAAARIVPQVPGVLTALTGLPGCRLARLSGGGPTCFGLFDDAAAAAAAAAELAAAQPGWWVRATRLG